MTDDEFAALIEIGAEQRHVEFKGPNPITDKHFIHKVVRAILGMANRRDGGYVVIGEEDINSVLNPVGIDEPVYLRVRDREERSENSTSRN